MLTLKDPTNHTTFW